MHLSLSQRTALPPLCHHPNSHFCPAHDRLPQNQPEPAEIASTLTANLDDFTSAAQINDFLARLLLLLAQDKISTRRAAVLAYITNQLLRTLPAIAKEENGGQTTIIIDMQHPERSPGDVSGSTGAEHHAATTSGQPHQAQPHQEIA